MRQIYKRKGYEQIIEYYAEIITKFSCTCPDFVNRKIKKIGEFSDIKYVADPCKHLKDIIEFYKIKGFKLKEINQEKGSNKINAEVKRIVNSRSKGICEISSCTRPAEEYHRMIRGSNGGTYTPENIKHLCEYHHQMIHQNEF